jgi:hypothetical protein
MLNARFRRDALADGRDISGIAGCESVNACYG